LRIPKLIKSSQASRGSRSLCVVVRPLSSVVCNVRAPYPTHPTLKFLAMFLCHLVPSISDLSVKILRRSSLQGNPPVWTGGGG